MKELKNLVACLLLSLLWNVLFWNHSYGISMPLFVVLAAVVALCVRRDPLPKISPTLLLHGLLLLYLSICVCVYRNDLICFAAIPCIYLALLALVFAGRDGYGFLNSLGVMEAMQRTIRRTLGTTRRAADEWSHEVNSVLDRGVQDGKQGFRIFLGLLVSLPFLGGFGWLFASADPLYQLKMDRLIDFFWEPEFWWRAIVVLVMWWGVSGYIVSSGFESSLQSAFDKRPPKQSFDGVATSVFLLMINLLFLSFLIIQLEYLFGGERVIDETYLTYAEYARHGFYELCTVTILVLLVIGITSHRLRETPPKVRKLVRVGWIALIAQTLMIVASSLKRIAVYEDAYGYTYLRILVGLFLLWMTGVFLLLAVKILAQKSVAWLAGAGISLALIFLLLVSTTSLDRFIAGQNIDRYLVRGETLDMEYLSRLSTDIVPELIRLEQQASEPGVRRAAREILFTQREYALNQLRHWPSWNLSLIRASQSP